MQGSEVFSLIEDLSAADFKKKYKSLTAKDLYNLEAHAFSREPYWSQKNYEDFFESSYRIYFTMDNKKELSAFIIYQLIDPDMEVLHWSVREKATGQGQLFFSLFLKKISIKYAKTLLECGEWNLPALAIYKKFGFQKNGFRPKYYRTGEGAWLLERSCSS
jgi:RimJ/RimL family protein N-acetyltransferase